MNKDCQIARDLMPLCLDGAASEGSESFVKDHTAACAECAAYYQGMQVRLPECSEEEKKREQKEFSKVARRMKNKRIVKITAIILCALLIGGIVSVLGWDAYVRYIYATVDLDTSEYDVLFSELEDGRGVVTLRFNTDREVNIYNYEWRGTELYVLPGLYRKSLSDSREKQNEPLMVISGDIMSTLTAIRKGEKGEIAWQQGDEIAPASEEMEAYYAFSDYVKHVESFLLGENDEFLGRDEYYVNLIDSHLEYLFSVVPEWQPYMMSAWYGHTPIRLSEDTLREASEYFSERLNLDTLLSGGVPQSDRQAPPDEEG